MQHMKMKDQIARRENARREIAGTENARHKMQVLENVRWTHVAR